MGRLLNKIKEPNDIKENFSKALSDSGTRNQRFPHRLMSVRLAGILPRIWEQWKLQWLCISVFIFQKIR